MKTDEMFIRPRQIRSCLHGQRLPQFIGAMDSARATTAFPVPRRRSRHRTGKSVELHRLPLSQALQVKQAELWLKLGEHEQALHQLKSLPQTARKSAWALKVQMAAIHAAREQNEL